jgi:hypothetical protein
MSEQKEFAFHMVNRKTGGKRIKKVKAADASHAHCSDVGCNKDWQWTGTEPWHNVSGNVEHIGGGYYIQKYDFV